MTARARREVFGVIVRFRDSAAFGGVCESIDGDKFTEDRSPFGGNFEVVEPRVTKLGKSGEEDRGNGIFLHAFVEAICKFLEAGSTVDREGDARGGGDDGTIGGLPIELAAFAIRVESVIECDVKGRLETVELQDGGE
jgi:hypothetical protein